MRKVPMALPQHMRNICENEEATRAFYKTMGMSDETAERAIAMAKATIGRRKLDVE
jgi:hypothetical protein